MRRISIFLFLLTLSGAAAADVVHVAVAANFVEPARELASRFEAGGQHTIRLSSGSTGKLYAQIVAGAPFDVFLAADEARPLRLVDAGRASQPLAYALGRLSLVSADSALAGRDCREAFLADTTATLAIANPETAPYGRAAEEVLAALGTPPSRRIVRGESVAQAMHFVTSRAARFGLVATAQMTRPGNPWPGCRWDVPAKFHAPIRQVAVLVAAPGAADGPASRFLDFLGSAEARALISARGYGLP
jgi:molybdate transport system substrate-binding protein